MKRFVALYLLIFPISGESAGKVDVHKLQKDGWHRDSHVIGVGKEPDYLLFRKGKEELKCYLEKDCGKALNDCVEYCGTRPRAARKANPPAEQVTNQKMRPELDPEVREILGDEAPSRDPPKKEKNGAAPKQKELPRASPANPVLNKANHLIQGFTRACYLNAEATLGEFKGIAYEKFAVFQKGGELYTCEIEKSAKCIRLASDGRDFFSPCVRVGSCIQNFRANDKQPSNCRIN